MFRRFATSSLPSRLAASRSVVHNFSGEIESEVKAAGGKPVVLDCFAEWCGPCIQFGPTFEALSEDSKYTGIRFVKMDVDAHDDVAASLGLRSVPTFVFFDAKGAKQNVVEGASRTAIEAALKALVAPQ